MLAPAALPPHRFYYLHNFSRALHWIAQRYGDLLNAQEQVFLQHFQALPQPSQALLVRMLMRRGPWFRTGKLQYEEIADLGAAAAPLLESGWLQTDTPMSAPELFALHTRAELTPMLGSLLHSATGRKQDWLQALLDRQEPARPYTAWNPQPTEAVWKVAQHLTTLCERFRLMFFGNLRQDWSEFVLADLGVLRYEAVDVPEAARPFRSRADVDGYLLLQDCRDAMEAADADVALLATQLFTGSSANPWLERRRARLLLRLGRHCERRHDWVHAEAVYAACHYPGARQRRVRVLELLDRHSDALALAELALQAPESEEETQKLRRMLPRLRRHLGERVPRASAKLPEVEAVRHYVELPRPATPSSVEYALRAHWQRDDAPVHYVENTLVTGLFGLLCWPAIFAPVPAAFFHPFQSAPADFGAPDFVQRRQDWFAACMAQLQDGSYRTTILERFVSKQGLQNPLVIWPALRQDLLEQALLCIPANHLQLLFARLLADPLANRTGLPDLVRFWPAQARYEMVEVKAPGDKLQDNQVRWLQYCAAHAIPVRVCHVTWVQAPTTGVLCA